MLRCGGEEQVKGIFVLRFPEPGADEEEEKGAGDADGDLVESHELEAESLGQAVDDGAAPHGEERSQFVRPAPEKPQKQCPEEGGLQSAEGEHVDEPDDAGGCQGDEEDDEPDDRRGGYGEETQTTDGGFRSPFRVVMKVDILDDGGRGHEEQAGDR